jgi:hypothetical protein
MPKPKIYKDPIHGQLRYENIDLKKPCPDDHGDKRLSWLLRRLIDTPCFQRLRHIRQNGLANLVFHGAEHSRFGHSMGVAFLAREMYDKITRNGDEDVDHETRLATCAAALLHDIGHGPFSHTLEDSLKNIDHTFNHETLTVRYITEPESEINKLLTEIDAEFPEKVSKFITKMRREPDHWSYKIVSSQLDADRLDYLLRDASMAGFRGHGFDLSRLLDMLLPYGECIAVDRRALEAVEAYLVMLDQMYRAVYFHHAIRAANVILESVFERVLYLYENGDKKAIFPRLGDKEVHPLEHLLQKKKVEEIDLSEYGRLGEFHLWQCLDHWTKSPKDPVLNERGSPLRSGNVEKSVDAELQAVCIEHNTPLEPIFQRGFTPLRSVRQIEVELECTEFLSVGT